MRRAVVPEEAGVTDKKQKEDKIIQSAIQTVPISKNRLWAGRILSALPTLFLLFDGVMKLIKPAPVVPAARAHSPAQLACTYAC